MVLVSKWPLFYLIMAPKCKSHDAGNSDMPKRSLKVFLLKRWKFLADYGKKKNCALRFLRPMVTWIFYLWNWEEGKRNSARLAVTSQTAKVMATRHDKCLVKMEKALNLDSKVFWERERPYSHNLFTIYYYNCSISSLIIIANLLLCLIYKLYFIIGMWVSQVAQW